MSRDVVGFDRAERRFTLLFLPLAVGFGGRMAMVVFDGPLARLFTDNGYLIGLLLAMGPLVATFANPLFGRLSDRTRSRFGRRIPFAFVGVSLSSLIFFAIPQAPSYAVLLGLFALRALFVSIGNGPLLSLVPDLIAPERRGRAMALFMFAGGIGAILIQGAGKVFWENHFALVFYVAGALSLGFAIPPLFVIQEPRAHPWEEVSARVRQAISPRTIFAAVVQGNPIALFLGSASLRYFGGGLLVSYFTLFAATDVGVSVGDASLAAAAAGGMRLLLALPAGRLADAYDRKRLLLLAAVASGVVHLLTGLWVRNLWQLYLAMGASTVTGVLEMIAGSPLFMDLLPSHRRGELIGINMVLTNVFQSAGALLGGAVFAWTAGYRAIYPIAALCYLASAVVLARLVVPAAEVIGGAAVGRTPAVGGVEQLPL